MLRKAQISFLEGMSVVNQWCVPGEGQDELVVDFDRSFSSLDVDLCTTSSSNVNTAVFAVPEITVRKEENKNHLNSSETPTYRCLQDLSGDVTCVSGRNNDRRQTDCHPISLVHGKKIRYSQYADIDCCNNVKRFCLNKEMEHCENFQTRCHPHNLSTPGANSSHFYSSGSVINTILSQVVQLPALPPPQTAEQEHLFESTTTFHYVLMAPTSAAVRLKEEPLTYLNQGQSYEIKIKRIGVTDFSELKGKLYKSILHLGFQERRLQYTEKEQISGWQTQRPSERIIEIDIPLSYGALEISNCIQNINRCEFLWEATKEIGIFLKVNCISTEFTAKKHGGEKGVPFRIVIETYAQDESCEKLHTASCQIKVFKPKGADRKHKTDREKLGKRMQCDKEKYHPQYEYTVFKDILLEDSWFDRPRSSSYCALPSSPLSNSPESSQVSPQRSVQGVNSDSQSDDFPNPSLESLTEQQESFDVPSGEIILTESSNSTETMQWLKLHMFGAFVKDFAHFSGSDLLNLKRRDVIDICGVPNGIRLYNLLHIRPGCPSLTLYVRLPMQQAFHAVYLYNSKVSELKMKLKMLCNLPANANCNIFLNGPSGIHIFVNDEVIQNMQEESAFGVEFLKSQYCDTQNILLKLLNS